MGKFKDLTGERFGRLIVIERAEDYVSPDGSHSSKWLCNCDCGNEVVVIGKNLTRKNGTKSCGCLRRDFAYSLNKSVNTYDLSGEYGIGYTSKGEEFYFDLEDYDKIKDYCWRINNKQYVCAKVNKKQILFHRLVMDGKDEVVDHINHNKADNRKSNLRVVTYSQNSMNMSLSKSNTSGVTGVFWNKRQQKWVAAITVNHKKIWLGAFNVFNEAVKARKEAEEKYFGEYSYDNSISYNIS